MPALELKKVVVRPCLFPLLRRVLAKNAEYTRQTPGVQRALQNHASQKKLQFERVAAKKREAGLETRFAYTHRAYAGHCPKQDLTVSAYPSSGVLT